MTSKSNPKENIDENVVAEDPTTTKIKQRLAELKKEQAAGQEMLNIIKHKDTQTTLTLTRISGAIQVLEEMLAQDAPKKEG